MKLIIDPNNITNLHREDWELEVFLIFAIAVAGRKSSVIAQKINEMFSFECYPSNPPDEIFPVQKDAAQRMHEMLHDQHMTPLGAINRLQQDGMLGSFLELHRLGQYTRIGKCLKEISSLRGGIHLISKVDVQKLESYSGIGPKTARFFMLHCFPDERLAVLDTHILSWMADMVELSLQRPTGTVPRTTPQTPSTYAFWELIWLGYCYKNRLDPADLDLSIWKSGSHGATKNLA